MKKFDSEKFMEIAGILVKWIPAIILGLFAGAYMENSDVIKILETNSLVMISAVYFVLATIYQIVDHFIHR